MRQFVTVTAFCMSFLIAGVAFGYVLGDAPRVEKKLQIERELQHTQEEVKEHKQRIVEWSHYVWKLEQGN